MRISNTPVRRFFSDMFDVLLPPRERARRVRAYTVEHLALEPVVQTYKHREIISLCSYKQRAAADAIRAMKFSRDTHAARLFARALHEYLLDFSSDVQTFSAHRIILTPVPLGRNRQRARGYNQTALVLAQLARIDPSYADYIREDVLVRSRETTPQMTLSRSERHANVAGAFAPFNRVSPAHAHVVLIDDVTTTGATLASAAEALENVGISHTLLALARA